MYTKKEFIIMGEMSSVAYFEGHLKSNKISRLPVPLSPKAKKGVVSSLVYVYDKSPPHKVCRND